MYTFLKKKKNQEMETYVGDELSTAVASPSGAVALGTLSPTGWDKNAIVAAFTTVLGMKNSNVLYFLHSSIISLFKVTFQKVSIWNVDLGKPRLAIRKKAKARGAEIEPSSRLWCYVGALTCGTRPACRVLLCSRPARRQVVGRGVD